MMTALVLIVFVAMTGATAYVLLRCVEGRKPALTLVERIALALALGPTLSMLPPFLADVWFGAPLGAPSFIVSTAVLAAAGFGVARLRGIDLLACRTLAGVPHPPRAVRIVLALLLVWTLAKGISFGATNLFLTPSYLDDTLDNWNLRAKVFYETQHFTLDLPHADPSIARVGVSSYPPAVPLMKATLAALGGGWSESAANGLHILWLFAPMALLWAGLRRLAGRFWAWVGVYVLGSLPLFLIHGVSAYADAFLATHLLAAVLPLVLALREQGDERDAWLRIAAVMTGILPFTKNEASVLYLPSVLLGAGVAGVILWRSGTLATALRAMAWYGACLVVLGLPWLAYKWSLGLAFGNAKQISTLAVSWYADAPQAIAINTLFEGNWLLLFPVLLVLLIVRWRDLRGPLLPAVAMAACAYAGQLVIFTCTPLALEAIRQTGYARGVVHLIPIFVFIGVLLLSGVSARMLGPWAGRGDE